MEQHPNYAGHTILDEAQARIAAAIYNALPPETDDPWNHVVLFDGKAGDGMMIVGNDGTLCQGTAVPRSHWPTLKRTVLGETS